MERAVVHVRSAGSFRLEPTQAEVLAPTLCNSIVSLHVHLCWQYEASFHLDTMSQLIELCVRLEDLHLNGCDKEPSEDDVVSCERAAGQLRHLKLSGVYRTKLEFPASFMTSIHLVRVDLLNLPCSLLLPNIMQVSCL